MWKLSSHTPISSELFINIQKEVAGEIQKQKNGNKMQSFDRGEVCFNHIVSKTAHKKKKESSLFFPTLHIHSL